jgi:hypothetical protein
MNALLKAVVVTTTALALPMAVAQDAKPTHPVPGANAPTPRLANGKPDLSGYWVDPHLLAMFAFLSKGGAEDPNGNVLIELPARDGRLQNLENDSYIFQKSSDNIPIYKPEHWARVRELDLNANREDPTFVCKPFGVPRIGPPARIVSLPNEVILFHTSGNPYSTMFRSIPIDRPRNKADLLIETWNGVPEAHWDGDTLVIESIGFNDESWLGWGGYFHSFDLKVTERIRREGNTLHYDVVAEDPTVLMEPYRYDPATLVLSPNPNSSIREAEPCSERDAEHIEGDIRG